MIQLRPYQADCIDQAGKLVLTGKTRIIIQAETGAGKAIVAAEMIRRCHAKGKRALFVARGRELVNQISIHLWNMDVPHGILMRGDDPFPQANIQVASKDTLYSWCHRRKTMAFPEADLVIFDEAHELGKSWVNIIKAYTGSILVGTTATPARSSGLGLGDIYDGLVMAIPTSQLIKDGWIVPSRVFAPYTPNLKGVKTSQGDYITKQLSERLDKATLVGNVVENWKSFAENRLSIVYGIDRRHAMHLKDSFLEADIPTEYVDGETPTALRDKILAEFSKDGPVRVICNVQVLKQGVDIPAASCCVLARPTRSFILYRQAIGRCRRPYTYPDGSAKKDCLVLDHSGAVHMHGLPDEDVPWELSPSTKIQDVMKKKLAEQGCRPIICPKCHCEFAGKRICPNCGHEIKTMPREVQTKAGKLVEIQKEMQNPHFLEIAQRYWNKALAIMAWKGRTAGVAAHMYYARYQEWPWERDGLYNVPDRKQWKMLVKELYPKFVK